MGRAVASLLYSSDAAAALSTDQLHSLGSSALLELEAALAANPNPHALLTPGTFAKFERTLVSTTPSPRELMSATAVARLDRQLDALLRALSLVFLHRAALKAMEYLIRIHAVHKHRPASLLSAVLPYHATPPFSRALALLAPHLPVESPWGWLKPASISRSVIVNRCSSSRTPGASIMRALCELANTAAEAPEASVDGVEGSVITSFAAVAIVEALPAAVAAGEAHVLPIVELVLKLLSPEAPPQSNATGLLLLAQLACHSPLSSLAASTLASSLATLIAQAPSAAAAEPPMLCLLLLTRSQQAAAEPFEPPTNLTRVTASDATVTSEDLATVDPALGALVSLSQRYDVTLLLPPILLSLAQQRPASSKCALLLLQQLPLESEEVASTLATLLFSLRTSDHAEAASWLWQILGMAIAASTPVPNSLDDPSAAKRILALQQLADELESAPRTTFQSESETAYQLLLSLSDGPAVAAAALALPGIIGRLPASHRRRALYSQLRRRLSGDATEHLLKSASVVALAADGAPRLSLLSPLLEMMCRAAIDPLSSSTPPPSLTLSLPLLSSLPAPPPRANPNGSAPADLSVMRTLVTAWREDLVATLAKNCGDAELMALSGLLMAQTSNPLYALQIVTRSLAASSPRPNPKVAPVLVAACRHVALRLDRNDHHAKMSFAGEAMPALRIHHGKQQPAAQASIESAEMIRWLAGELATTASAPAPVAAGASSLARQLFALCLGVRAGLSSYGAPIQTLLSGVWPAHTVLIGLATLWSPTASLSSPIPAGADAKWAEVSAEGRRSTYRRMRLRALQLTATQLRALASAARAVPTNTAMDITPVSPAPSSGRASRSKKQTAADSEVGTPGAAGAHSAIAAAVAAASEQLLFLLLPVASGSDVLLAAVAIDCLRALATAHEAAIDSPPDTTMGELRRDSCRPDG